jgi:hypothetical protein
VGVRRHVDRSKLAVHEPEVLNMSMRTEWRRPAVLANTVDALAGRNRDISNDLSFGKP